MHKMGFLRDRSHIHNKDIYMYNTRNKILFKLDYTKFNKKPDRSQKSDEHEWCTLWCKDQLSDSYREKLEINNYMKNTMFHVPLLFLIKYLSKN